MSAQAGHRAHEPDWRCRCKDRRRHEDPECAWASRFKQLFIRNQNSKLFDGHHIVVVGTSASSGGKGNVYMGTQCQKLLQKVHINAEDVSHIVESRNAVFLRCHDSNDVPKAVRCLSKGLSGFASLHVSAVPLCCCSPEIPHCEEAKFVLLTGDSSDYSSHQICPFPRLPQGRVREVLAPAITPPDVPQPYIRLVGFKS